MKRYFNILLFILSPLYITAVVRNEIIDSLADKTDVRRTRVRSTATIAQELHDRVNSAVEHSEVRLDT